MSSLEGPENARRDNLNAVVAWLHQQGFHAAESALLGEVASIVNVDHVGSSGQTWESAPEASPRPPEHDMVNLSTSTCRAQEPCDDSLPSSAEKVVEAWRGSKCSTPVTSPRKTSPFLAATSPPQQPSPSGGLFSPQAASDVDEYEDEDDAGYWRVPVSGQDSLYFTAGLLATAGQLPSKSPSTSSLQCGYAHSRHSSLEVPLQLQAPVLGESQVLRSGALPPLPNGSMQRCLSASAGQQQPQSGAAGMPGIDRVDSGERSPGVQQQGPAGVGQQRSSAELRHAGTAKWVFDRQNSAGSEAYKSLVSYLDHQSPRTQPLALGSADASETDGGTPARSQLSNPSNGGTPRLLETSKDEGSSSQQASPQQAEQPQQALQHQPVWGGAAEEGSAATGDISRVSSLSESVIQEMMVEAMSGVRLESDSLPQRLAKPTSPQQPPPPCQPQLAVKTTARSIPHLAVEDDSSSAEQRSPDKLAPGDPFSFPVTSPSEQRETVAPVQPGTLFSSWPSFKNLGSPARSQGGDYCSTEDESSTPARFSRSQPRTHHYHRLSASASVGGAPGAAPDVDRPGKLRRHMLRSTSHHALAGNLPVGSGSGGFCATPTTGGQYGDLALYSFDEAAIEAKYDVFEMRVIHRRGATGFEESRELPLRINDLVAGRYQIVDLLGQAAFSRAVQALDLKTGSLVCLKVVKNNKDYFDQSLDEIKVLRYVNNADPCDEHGILRLYDYFYFKEHLILVTELLRANLYEFLKHNRESGDPAYFSPDRVQSVARQVLSSLAFLHSLGLVHADLKPENILMKSYSACEVKVIDLGSSCFLTDRLSSYIQSRSYRAPEVILGLPYGQKIDIWSLGCIIVELVTGRVLLHNAAPAAILARIEGILGPVPGHMLALGRFSHRYYTSDGRLYDRNRETGQLEVLRPKRSTLARRVPGADPGMIAFLSALLQVDPSKRPTAAEALQHPWLQQPYVATSP